MNIFVNSFGRAGKFSVKDIKSNLRRWILTDRARQDSFHFISLHFISFHFTWIFSGKKQGKKIGDSHQNSAVSGGQPLPDSLGNSQGFFNITFYSPLSRRNVQKSGSPNDEQMQFT
jgi:hypothetical protein